MAEIFEMASDYEQRQRDASVANRVVYRGISAEECEECGVAISPDRQLAVLGCRMCASCTTANELRSSSRR